MTDDLTTAKPFKLVHGELVVIGKKLYGRCPRCAQIVRLNKPIIGDLHVCSCT